MAWMKCNWFWQGYSEAQQDTEAEAWLFRGLYLSELQLLAMACLV